MALGTWTITTPNSTTNWQGASGWTNYGEPNNGGIAYINQGTTVYNTIYDATSNESNYPGNFSTIGGLIVNSPNATLDFNVANTTLNVNTFCEQCGYDPNGLTALNAGTIDISSATATLNTINFTQTGGTFIDSAGTLTVATDANFTGGKATFNGGTFNGIAALTVNGAAATVNFNGATVALGATNVGAGTLNMSAGTASMGALTVQGTSTFDISGGTYDVGTNNANLTGGTTTLSGGTFNGGGTLDLGGGTLSMTGGNLNNVVTVVGSGTFSQNAGTANVGATTVTGTGTFDLSGTGTFNTGTASLTVNSTGAIFDQTGGQLNVGSANFNAGTVNLGGNVNDVGQLNVDGAAVTASGTNITAVNLNVSSGTFTQSAGTVRATTGLTVTGGNFNVSGGTVNTSTGILAVTGGTFNESSGQVNVGSANFNAGTVNLGGSVNDSALLNVDGATVTASGTNITAASLNVSSGSFTQSAGTVTANNANFTGGTDTIGPTFNAGVLDVGGSSTVLDLNGGTLTVTTGAATVESGDTIGFAGGTLDAMAGGVDDSGSMVGMGTITGALSGNGVVEASGGTLDLTSDIVGSGPSYEIDNSATSVLQIDGTVGADNTFTFLGSAGELAFNNAATLDTGFANMDVGTSNVAPTDIIELFGQNVTLEGPNGFTGTSATIELQGGGTDYTLNLSNLQGNTGSTWYVDYASASSGGTDVFLSDVVCFAAGTRILTATGERIIETLLAGDIVLTLSGGQLSAQPVKWVGYRRIDLTAHPQPETVAPVRIEAGAFAENMPHTDLLLSPDHAIFVDGKLIAARQLINGTTIRQEKDRTSVEYFHVELDSHAILFAEGLPAESYLDTGNRGFFANSGEPLVLHPNLTDESDYPLRAAASCAPFVTDDATVRPAWQRLAERAASLGRPAPRCATVSDPALHIVAKGRTVQPMYGKDGLFIFVVPKGATEVHLVSRASSPASVWPWLDDRRSLGVCVKAIVLRSARSVQEIALNDSRLTEGWWAVEQAGTERQRWTNGTAGLQLSNDCHEATMLEIQLCGQMAYLAEEDADRAAATAVRQVA